MISFLEEIDKIIDQDCKLILNYFNGSWKYIFSLFSVLGFIKNFEDLSCKRQIITISSGAATKPYEGWSVYCTSKAAIDMMTKAIAAEQRELKNGLKCVAIYPGVVDTNMQTTIRSTNEKNFKNLQRFIDLKENNELYTPEFVANSIFKIDTENQLENGDIIDIRHF